MSEKLYLADDGDEVVFVATDDGKILGEISHEAYGWGGMREVIALVEKIAETFDIEVRNLQDIV